MSNPDNYRWTSEWSKAKTLLFFPATREYCEAHGLKLSRGRKDPCRLYEHERAPTRVERQWGRVCDCELMPCVARPAMFNMEGKPAVFISQPYDTRAFKDLLLWSYSRPLAVALNEWPAWEFPGHTHFIEVWAAWAWDIARERRAKAPKPTAAAKWVETWGEIAAKAVDGR